MPAPNENPRLSAALKNTLGIPEGFALYSPAPFGGMNFESSRIGIQDSEFYWRENLIRVGDFRLKTVGDIGTPLYVNNSKIIATYFFYNLGPVAYCAVFFTDGTAVQVRVSDGAQTVISNVPNTFFQSGGGNPAQTGWGTQYLLISNNNTENDYWIWDGTVFYSAGGCGPQQTILNGGAQYNSVPTVTAYGGHGSGIVITPTVENGMVTLLTVASPGITYDVGAVVQLQFSGGGSDTAAILKPFLNPGSVEAVGVNAEGFGYTFANISFTGPTGSGATAVAVITGGKITAINVTGGGSGYTQSPFVVITGDGTGAVGQSYITASGVAGVAVDDPGTNYTSAPLLTFQGGNGSGATGVVKLADTTIAKIQVTSPGTGYYHMPTIRLSGGTFSDTDDALNYTFDPVLSNGGVVAINITGGNSPVNTVPSVIIQASTDDIHTNGTLPNATGAAATAILAPTTIEGVVMKNYGESYTSDPACIIAPGSNNAAAANVLTMMPFGSSGASIESFQQQVWLARPFQRVPTLFTNGTILLSAPESLTDFATSDGGLLYASGSPFLAMGYFDLKVVGDYLYAITDSSVDVISNVSTSGSPPTTTFNYDNTDPQTGTQWRGTVQNFARTALLTNALGVYGIYGGATTKLSEKMDQIFLNAVFPPNAGALTPSAAVGTIENRKIYASLLTINDKFWGGTRNIMVTWDEKDWFVTTQSPGLTMLQTLVQNGEPIAYGSDGHSIWPLFQTPSASLPKRLATKLYGATSFPMVKLAMSLHLTAASNAPSAGIVFNPLLIDTENGSYPAQVNFNFVPGQAVSAGDTGNIYGSYLGMRFISTSPDFELYNIALGYTPWWSGYGSPPSIQGS